MTRAPYNQEASVGNDVAKGCMFACILIYGIVLALIAGCALVIGSPYLIPAWLRERYVKKKAKKKPQWRRNA